MTLKWNRSLSALLLAACLPLGTAQAYDDDATAEQQQTEKAQGKQVTDQFNDAQQALRPGDSVKSRITSPAQLAGRAQRAFESWQSRGWNPQAFVVDRRGRQTWLLTGKTTGGSFRYAFFHIPNNP